MLDSSYSQIRQHVSDLTATGAATAADLAPPYILLVLLVPLLMLPRRDAVSLVGIVVSVLFVIAGLVAYVRSVVVSYRVGGGAI